MGEPAAVYDPAAHRVHLEVVGPLTFAQLLEDWERWMRRRDRSANTIETYRSFLDRLASEVKLRDVRDLTARDLDEWQDRLREAGLASGSRMLAVTAMRSVLKFARRQRLDFDPYLDESLESIKVRSVERREILEDDFRRLVAYLTPRPPAKALSLLRTRALFFYLLYSGARVSEVLQVRRDLYDRVQVRQKGGSMKVLYLPADALTFVREYLDARTDENPWLFVAFVPGRAPELLRPDGVRDIWRRLCRRLGVAPFTTHQLRHSHATYAKRAGVDRDVTQAQLGHTDPRMMERYRHWDDDARQGGVDRLQDYVRGFTEPEGPPPRPILLPRLRKRPGGR